MNTLKTIGRNAVLFAIGGTIYYMIELIWRGYSSLPMVLVGGLCFLFCGSINEFLGWDMLIWKQMFICAAGITAIEFLSGYILNIVLRLGIWDYSNMPFNIIGQIQGLISVRSDRMLLILQMKRDSRYLKYRGGFEWLKSCGSYVLQ